MLSFRLFQHQHSRLACSKAVHRKNHGRRSKIQSFFKRPTAIYADGACAWSKAATVLKVPFFQANHQQKEYASTIRKVPIVEHSGTQTIDSDWKSLECWLPKEASKKKSTCDLVTQSSQLEQRVWQWMWRRTKLRGNNSEKLAAMSKLFNG